MSSKKPSENAPDWQATRNQIIGLGERSVRKSYFPQLQARIAELERFNVVMDHTPDVILVVKMSDRRIIYANQTSRKILCDPNEEIIGQQITEVIRDDVLNALMSCGSDTEKSIEACLQSKNDGTIPYDLTFRAITLREGSFGVIIGRNIEIRKSFEQKLMKKANFDDLTGLPNRALFMDRLDRAIRQAQRQNWKMALFFIDLDRFKQINDSLGHAVGDRLLYEAAQRLLECVRSDDTVARVGGDEFTLIFPDLGEATQAEIFAERILEAMAKPFIIDGQEAYAGASIGITIYPDDGDDLGILMQNADAAMYRAKGKGRNQHQFFQKSMNEAVQARQALETQLRHALSRDELTLHFQPIVDLSTGRARGAEALLRWTNSVMGPVTPDTFIPIAEETGLIIPIGDWVMETAIKQAMKWAEKYKHFTIAINVSPRQLREPGFVTKVEQYVQKANEKNLMIDLEMTESLLIDNNPENYKLLKTLADLGFRLALDDFGTGYSSLSYLKRFPIDILKIDRAFVQDLGSDPETGDGTLSAAILAMAHSLGLDVVAEGLETEQQVEFHRSRGCQLGQGYFLGRPMPADKFEQYLQNQKPSLLKLTSSSKQ